MDSNAPKDDMHKLVDAFVDGQADDHVIDELSRRLSDDPAARKTYIEYMSIEAELAIISHDPALGTTPEMAGSNRSAAVSQSPGTHSSGNRRWLTQWLAICASLLIVAGGSSWLTYERMRDHGNSIAKADHRQCDRAARRSQGRAGGANYRHAKLSMA